MYKVRKCQSTDLRKNFNELDQYVDGYKKAELNQWLNLHKNECKCQYSCKYFKGQQHRKMFDSNTKKEDLNDRMIYQVDRMIRRRAEQILKKLRINDVGIFDQIDFVEQNIIGETSYFELQRQYRQACLETSELEKAEIQCQKEIEEKHQIIQREYRKIKEKEEFKEKVDQFNENDPTLSDMSVRDFRQGCSSCSSFILESYYDSDYDSVDQDLERWDQFIKKERCVADLSDHELNHSVFVKKEASRSKVYMKYLVLKQEQRSRKISRKVQKQIEDFKRKKEANFIDSFGYTPFGTPVTRAEIEYHLCLKESCIICKDYGNRIQDENQIDSFK